MTINLTEAAAKRIQEQLAKRGSGLGLRIGVKTSGCSGYSYVIDYADEIKQEIKYFSLYNSKKIHIRFFHHFAEHPQHIHVHEQMNPIRMKKCMRNKPVPLLMRMNHRPVEQQLRK